MSKLSDKFKALEKPHPPIAPPKTIKKENLSPPGSVTKKVPQEEFSINFDRIARLSTFERFLIDAVKIMFPQLKGISTRTSKEVMSKAFTERITEIDKAVSLFEVVKHDSVLIREIKSNPLYLKQASKHNK